MPSQPANLRLQHRQRPATASTLRRAHRAATRARSRRAARHRVLRACRGTLRARDTGAGSGTVRQCCGAGRHCGGGTRRNPPLARPRLCWPGLEPTCRPRHLRARSRRWWPGLGWAWWSRHPLTRLRRRHECLVGEC
jgi:hypothetical protein